MLTVGTSQDISLIAFGSGNWPAPLVEIEELSSFIVVPSISDQDLSLIVCACGNWAAPLA
jgi:hypothetical protein